MKPEWIIAITVASVVVLAVALIVIKRFLPIKGKGIITLDSIVGEKCVVTEKIDNFAGCGQIKVKGQLWSARGFFDDDVFECGESLRIVAIEGVKAVCKK